MEYNICRNVFEGDIVLHSSMHASREAAAHLTLHPLLKVALLIARSCQVIVHALHLLGELRTTLLLETLQERLLLLLYLPCVQQPPCQLLAVELTARKTPLHASNNAPAR